MNTTFLLAALAAAAPPTEALRCPAPAVAKGDVKAGPALTHTFDLSNGAATGTVTITKVEAGCGCLRRTLSAGVLQPGETARLTLEVNTLTQPDGPNRWQATVAYVHDAPGPAGAPPTSTRGELLLNLTATLSREVVVTPAQVAWSTTGVASQEITVADRRAKPLTVLKGESSSPYVTVAVGPRGAGQTVTVRLAAEAPVGARDEVVVLATDDPAYPEFRIPVRVQKRAPGGVTATPDRVAARLAVGQPDASTIIQIRASGGTVAIESAMCDHPSVAVKWSTGSGAVAALRVTVPAALAASAGQTVVRVRMASPAEQDVVIPVSWTVGSGK